MGRQGSGEALAPGEGMVAEALAWGSLQAPQQPQTDFQVAFSPLQQLSATCDYLLSSCGT